MEGIMTLFPLIILILIMYFLLIRPQKKREKEVNSMRSAIKVGDEIITIGGIYGKVVKTKDDTLTIAVGSDKTKFEVTRWAVSKVVNEQPTSNKSQKDSAPEEEAEPVKKSLPKRMKKTSSEVSTEADAQDDEPIEVQAEVVQEAEVVETVDAEEITTEQN